MEAKKTPEEIISFIFTPTDLETMIKLLVSYQKRQPEWDVFRKKIPADLLDKWSQIMRECRENGFMNPRVKHGDQITWKRIMGFPRNYKNVDACTLCPATFIAGDCKGRVIYNHHGDLVFRPCWHAVSAVISQREINEEDVPF